MKIMNKIKQAQQKAHELVVAQDRKGEYYVLFASADSPEEAQKGIGKLLVEEEVGEMGMRRMQRQLLIHGPLLPLHPRPKK